MKSYKWLYAAYVVSSLPVRGAWIEMLHSSRARQRAVSRSPCGERGLKFRKVCIDLHYHRRSPCGERGLKCGVSRGVLAHFRRSPCGERGLKSNGEVKEYV